ncbi:MAG: hypothetical protein IVW55_17465 [Chloroflexi bacterium]|nr:hypothetical protein [Chloroflexota bacterium]
MWDKIKSILSDTAPLIGTLVGGPAGTAIGSLLSSALGTPNNPDAIYAKLQSDPTALAKVRELEIKQQVQLRALMVQAETQRLASDTSRIQAVNATMRAEIQDKRGYWREAFGYISAACFAMEVGAVVYVLVWNPTAAGAASALISSLTMLWGVPLSVLGITAWHAGAADRLKLGDTSLSAAMAARTKK